MAYKLRRVYSLVFVVLNASASVQVAHAQSATTETANVAMAASSPAGLEPENASAPGGNVAALAALNAQGMLTELRSSSATAYQAQLLFYGEGLTYYVALLQQNNYWLVVDTPSAKRAEAIYAEFVQRTLRLSQGNQQRVELEARAAGREHRAGTDANPGAPGATAGGFRHRSCSDRTLGSAADRDRQAGHDASAGGDQRAGGTRQRAAQSAGDAGRERQSLGSAYRRFDKEASAAYQGGAG